MAERPGQSYATLSTRKSWWPDAYRLATEGLSHSEIAERLGVTKSAVWKALNPGRAAEAVARSNAKPGRREAQNAASAASSRKSGARGRCTECGGLRGIGVRTDGICVTCQDRMREWRWATIEHMWAEGAKYAEILDALGWTYKGRLTIEIDRMRKAGRNVPYRYKTWRGKPREGLAA